MKDPLVQWVDLPKPNKATVFLKSWRPAVVARARGHKFVFEFMCQIISLKSVERDVPDSEATIRRPFLARREQWEAAR